VLVSKIGACPRDELKAAGIEPVDEVRARVHREGRAGLVCRLLRPRGSGEIVHQPRGDARIRQGAFTRPPPEPRFQPITQGDPHGPEDHRPCAPPARACEPECPNVAIREKGGTFIIDPAKCTECEGHFDAPQCIAVCPVDGCIKKV
jgi:ferredoxin